jgi:glycosyltransferase involved in cell wall biosynthesis
MNPKVSIIVPIYNMEKYLGRCLKSLLGQSLPEIEIIAVNDGSLDSSLKILQEYAAGDRRIKIIDKANEGVSAARNDGIQAANGQFIGFVDPDDWVAESMYDVMYKTAIERNIDIVMCSYIREFGTHEKEKQFDMPHMQIYRKDEVQMKMLRRLIGPLNEEVANPEFLDAWGTVWSKLYCAELLKRNGLEFKDLSIIGSNEDTLFNIHAFYYASSFAFLNRPYYHYWRANLASITSTYNPMLAQRFEKLYTAIQEFMTEKQLLNEFAIAFNNRICMNVLGLGLNIMSENQFSSTCKKLRDLSDLLHSERVCQSFKQFDMQCCPLVWRTFFLCAKLKFSLAIYTLLKAINIMRMKNIRRTKVESSSNPASGNNHESGRLREHVDELLPQTGSKQNSV